MNCDANIILGYHWLRARDLNFLYDSDAVCLCAERDCTRLLTDAAELAVTVILELQWSSGAARRRWRVPSRRLRVAQTTQPERSCPPHLLELLAAVAPASIRAVLPSDPVLGPQGSGGGGAGAGPPRCCLLPCGQSVGLRLVCRNGLLYRRIRRGDRFSRAGSGRAMRTGAARAQRDAARRDTSVAP